MTDRGIERAVLAPPAERPNPPIRDKAVKALLADARNLQEDLPALLSAPGLARQRARERYETVAAELVAEQLAAIPVVG